MVGFIAAALLVLLSTASADARSLRRHGMPWCGLWMSQHVYGRSIRPLWIARNWARVGRPAHGPAPGVIGVQRHHVFRVVSVAGPGLVLAISGNDGNRVRTRIRSTRRVIAWRIP